MRTIGIFIALFFTVALHAIEIDSVKRREMVLEGQSELCDLLEYNSHVTDPLEMRFTVVIDGNEPTYQRIKQERVDNSTASILSQTCVDSLDAILSRTYRDYNIEMYVVVIKTFNLIVWNPLPQNFAVTDLFNTPLYDETTNIACLRNWHTSITNDIINNSFSARNRDCLVYSRATYTGSLVPGKTGSWDFSKRIRHYASPRTYPKLDELADYYYDRIVNNPNVRQAGLEYSLEAAAREFNESAKFIVLKAAILYTYTSVSMSGIFALFNETVDYENLTEEERVHALAVFAGYPMFDNGVGQQERYACKIIENTPVAQVPIFLYDLSQVSPLNTNPLYEGDKPNKALVVCLIDHVDDVGPGGDNYARMTRAFTNISLSSKIHVESHLPNSDQQWLDRQFYWDDWYALSTPPVGTHDYNITLNSDGTLKVEKEVVDRHDEVVQGAAATISYEAHWDDDYTEVTLNPFDLVVITNRSSLGMVQVSGAAPNQPYLAPAIFLKFCDDKEFNSQAVTTTAVVLSAVAVITGPAAILGAVQAGNVALAVFEGLQFVGATADLVVNASASQQYNEAVTIFNQIVGAWGISRLAISGVKYTSDYISGVTSNAIGPVPMSTAQTYCGKYDAITSWANVDGPTSDKMRRMREVLGEQVAVGNAAIDLADMLVQRKNFWDEWVNKCFPNRNWSTTTFTTEGVDYQTFKNSSPSLDEEMRGMYASTSDADKYIPGIIKSGSTNPVRVTASEGQTFYKLVPKGSNISGPSPYYLTETEFQAIRSNPSLIEQRLGLPLSSCNAEYDIYTITSLSDNNAVFSSTIAPTHQFASSTPSIIYNTAGGATQTLIINNNNVNLWRKSTAPIETLSPSTLPTVTN